MAGERVVFNCRLLPHELQQLRFSDDPATLLDQNQEDFEGFRRERRVGRAPPEQALSWVDHVAPTAGEGGADAPPPPPMTGTWNGQPCAVPVAGGAGGPGGGGRGGRGRGEMTPEQQAAQQEQAAKLKAWRTSVSMDAFKKLRKMYNDAGVTIYAWKQLSTNMSDEEYEYIFNVAEALGCTHTTLELPTDAAALKRLGDFAMKKKVYAAYHTHLQGSMTAFDQAFALSKGNMANVDFGHWVAAGNVGGTPMQFLEKHHARISSFHLKDRTTPAKLRAQSAVGYGRDADQGNPPAGEEEQVEDPRLDRARIRHPRRLGRREGNEEVRGVLPDGAHGEELASSRAAVSSAAAGELASRRFAPRSPLRFSPTCHTLHAPIRDTVLALWSESSLAPSC